MCVCSCKGINYSRDNFNPITAIIAHLKPQCNMGKKESILMISLKLKKYTKTF